MYSHFLCILTFKFNMHYGILNEGIFLYLVLLMIDKLANDSFKAYM